MKKLALIMVLVMGAFVANAQKTPVKVSDLQKTITDNISKNYAGYTIKDAWKLVDNNVTTYDVEIAKGDIKETLQYDNNGNFLKKIEGTAGSTNMAHSPMSHKSSAEHAKKPKR